ncbi:MAG: agmatinase [Gemmatimonadota bacterium]|nr:MAG: agmatinase [Gemmatimonadota bacterium]
MEQRKIAIIGLPDDKQSSFLRGPAQAPQQIRDAFHCDSTNTWSESGLDLGGDSVIVDAGDVAFNSSENPMERIESTITDLLNKKSIPISLGGDHAVTYPIIKAFSEKYPRLHVLQFDAHPDLYDELDGNRYSHACPFARIMEEGLVERLVQVGIRAVNGHQRERAQKFGVEVNEMKDWHDDLSFEFSEPLYISFDVDVLDPAFAPGVSHHEPGGLTTRQAIRLIQNVNAPAVVGADIVEFNPDRDPAGITAMACAKILKEIVARMVG